jgi:hypothetical protein
MKRAVSILALLSLSGCSMYKHGISDYSHSNAAEEQRELDEEECEKKGYEARGNAGGGFVDGFLGTSVSYNKGFRECVEAKGYKLK